MEDVPLGTHSCKTRAMVVQAADADDDRLAPAAQERHDCLGFGGLGIAASPRFSFRGFGCMRRFGRMLQQRCVKGHGVATKFIQVPIKE